jgi:hypothetical protein
MYYSGYNKIFWGLLFIFININVGPIDIFPNIIGYIMVYIGLGELSSQHQIFAKGKLPTLILGLDSIRHIIKIDSNNQFHPGAFSLDLLLSALNGMLMLVTLYMMFCIFRGIYTVAQNKELEELKNETRSRFNAYFCVNAALAVYLPFSINLPGDFAILGAIIVIIKLITVFLLLGIVNRARKQLSE